MRKSLALAFAPVLLAARCYDPGMTVRLAPETQPYRPVFYAHHDSVPVHSIGRFTVEACRPHQIQKVVWEIERSTEGDTPRPLRISYGQLPSGYTQKVAPEPLAAGRCYAVLAQSPGRGELSFRLADDGTPTPGGNDGWRQFERAAVACKRAYRRARTPEAIAAANVLAQPVADTTVSCGTFSTRWRSELDNAESSEMLALKFIGGIAALTALFWLEDALKLPKE